MVGSTVVWRCTEQEKEMKRKETKEKNKKEKEKEKEKERKGKKRIEKKKKKKKERKGKERKGKERKGKKRREVTSGPSMSGEACAGYVQNMTQDLYTGLYFRFVEVMGRVCAGNKTHNTEKARTVYSVRELFDSLPVGADGDTNNHH
jgi:hypothetical protein